MTSITLRVPADVLERLKSIASQQGLRGYQILLNASIGDARVVMVVCRKARRSSG